MVFFQEHKVRRKDQAWFRNQLKDAGWKVHFSPSYEGGKRAAAGVGVMWREGDVHVYPDRILDPDLREARERGMVGRYILDVGWHKQFAIYNVYGESGCTATTEALLAACRKDMLGRNFYSTMVMGDFNATPHKLGPVADWIFEDNGPILV